MAIRVVFLSFYFEAWDSLAPVYERMLANPRFEPIVISIPRRFTGETEYGHEAEVSANFERRGIEHLRFDFADPFEGNRRLRELAPDYVFLNYPWQRNYQPGFRPDALAEFTKLCYVPYYSLPLVNEPGVIGVAPHLYRQRLHQLASMVFAQDGAVCDAYADTQRGNGYVHLVGSPKLDALVEQANASAGHWPIQRNWGGRAFRLVWAPHHSYSEHWLNFGVFASMHQQMLEFATRHQELEILARPHPFLFGTLVDRGVLSAQQLEIWLDSWNALPNTGIDLGGNYAEVFKACDLLLTDGISFIGEYPLVTGKPAIFMENPDHWAFSPIGEVAANANLRVRNFDEFEALFDQIRTVGMPERSDEIAALAASARPFPGEAAKRIVDLVLADSEAKTPLIDPSQVTETPWELEPGREPFTD